MKNELVTQSVTLQVRKRQIFTTVLSKSADLVNLPKRELEILKARYDDIPIHTIPTEWFSGPEWKKKVLVWIALVGIRDNPPDETNENLLLEFVLNEYSGMTFSEIELAFKMNLMGELQPTVNHYNSLNVNFLTQVIRAYSKKRVEVDEKYKDICHKLQYLPPSELSQEQADYYSGRSVYLKYKSWLTNAIQPVGLHLDHKFLSRIGLLQDDEALQHEAMIVVQSDMSTEVENSLAAPGTIGAAISNTLLLKAELKDRANAYITMQYFEQLKLDGADFQRMIREAILHTHATQGEGTQ